MKKLRLGQREARVQGYLSVLPIILIIALFKGYPIVVTIMKSFTNWDGLFKNDFVGLKNYITVFQNGAVMKMITNTLALLFHIPIVIFLGFIVSVLFYEGVKGTRFFKIVIFIPQFVSAVVIGYLFRTAFGLNGPINAIIKSIFNGYEAVNWLGDRFAALSVIVIAIIWLGLGRQTLILLGGMSSISHSILEAAELDGAGYWRKMFLIIMPMLKDIVAYSTVSACLYTFTGTFSFIYTITSGGPGYETTTLDYMIYLKAFEVGNKMGEACAVAVILLIIVLIITVFQMKLMEKREY